MIYVVGNAVYTLPDYTSESSSNNSNNENENDFVSSYVTISDFLFFLKGEINFCKSRIPFFKESEYGVLYDYKLRELQFLFDKYFSLLKNKFKE